MLLKKSYKAAKSANVHRPKLKAKLIEWEVCSYSQGIRYVPIEASDMPSQPKKRKNAGEETRAKNNNFIGGETALMPMDIDETFWGGTSKKKVRKPLHPYLTNLTYLPGQTLIHWRIYSKDWPLLMLPAQFWECFGNDYVPELQVCSVQVEVLRLLSGTCTLQGVLLEVPPASPISQSSKVGRKILCAILVAGSWGALAIWAL